MSICYYFCKGESCKYEEHTNWENNAINGLYSNWITPQIMAMQRPSTFLLKEFNIIQEFLKLGIHCIINVQELTEHAHCAKGLDSRSGFSYDPQDFMDQGISVFPMGWPDMGIPTLSHMLSIVQIMSFMLKKTDNVLAVHCHAGLGRTGTAIACYLVYDKKMSPKDAIELIRHKRPGSIQNRKQTLFVYQFEKYLDELKHSFPHPQKAQQLLFPEKMNLVNVLTRQNLYLHGDEQRKLKTTPKILYELFQRIQNQSNPSAILNALVSYSFAELKRMLLWDRLNHQEWSLLDSLELETCIDLVFDFIISLDKSIIPNEFSKAYSSAQEWVKLNQKNPHFDILVHLAKWSESTDDHALSTRILSEIARILCFHRKVKGNTFVITKTTLISNNERQANLESLLTLLVKMSQ